MKGFLQQAEDILEIACSEGAESDYAILWDCDGALKMMDGGGWSMAGCGTRSGRWRYSGWNGAEARYAWKVGTEPASAFFSGSPQRSAAGFYVGVIALITRAMNEYPSAVLLQDGCSHKVISHISRICVFWVMVQRKQRDAANVILASFERSRSRRRVNFQ